MPFPRKSRLVLAQWRRSMVEWPHGHDGGKERAPRPAFHDKSGSAFWGVEDHAAISGGLGGAGWRRLRRASLLTAAKPPLASVTGRRTSSSSSPTSARLQGIVWRRNKVEGTGSKAPTRHCRDRQHVLKKTTVH